MIMRFSISIFFLFSLLTCGKKNKIGPQVVPSSLFFVIKNNGLRLDDATLNGMKMYFVRNGSRSDVTDFVRGTGEGYDLGVLTTRNVGFISADEQIKDFYLEFPNGDIDTLFVDYRHLNENDAFRHSCYCYYPLELVKYNNVVAAPDPLILQQKVYRFDKR